MIKRLAIILGSLVAILLVAIIGLLIFIQTPAGLQLADRISRPIVEDVVKSQLGSDISYKALSGKLPNLLVIEDLRLSQNGEVWAEADRFILNWDAKDLLRRHIHIEEIVLADAALIRLPDLPEQDTADDAATPEQDRGGPVTFPTIRLDTAVIERFTIGEEIIGTEQTVSLNADVRTRKRAIRANLFGKTETATDDITLTAFYNQRQLSFETHMTSRADGVIASLAQADAAIELHAGAAGPLDAIQAQVIAELAQYGAVEADLGASASLPDRFSVNLAVTPGRILPEEARAAIGDALLAEFTAAVRRDQIDVVIDELKGAFGTVAGQVEASLPADDPAEELYVRADLNGDIEPSVLEPYGAEALAGPLALTAIVAQDGEAFAFSGDITAGSASVAIADGRSSPDQPIAGQITARVKDFTLGNPQLDPLLKSGASLNADVTLAKNDQLTVQNLNARVGGTAADRVTARGDAAFNLMTQAINADIALGAGATALARFVDGATFTGPLNLTLRTRGTRDKLAVKASGTLPGGRYAETSFTQGALNADVSGLPLAPSGNVLLTSPTDDYRIGAVFATEEAVTTLDQLIARIGPLNINASGAFDREQMAGNAALTIDAGPGVILPGGTLLAGELRANANVAPDGPIAIDARATNLIYADNEIERLTVTADGPRDAISYAVDIFHLTVGDNFVETALASGVADVEGALSVDLNKLDIALSPRKDGRIRLLSPTNVALGETITIAPTAIDVFNQGAVNLSGSFAPDRWQADISAASLTIPQADATLDLTFALDTDAPQPGTLALRLEAEQGGETFAFDGQGTWDGRDASANISILGTGGAERGQLTAALPVVLTRGETLRVEPNDADLRAQFTYNGPLKPLVVLAPLDDERVSGSMLADVSVTGPFTELHAEGSVNLVDTRIEDRTFGIVLNAINGGVTFSFTPEGTRGAVDITASGAEDRERSIKLLGSLNLIEDGSSLDLAFTANRAQIARNSELELRLTTDLRLNGSFEEMTLSGPITLDELDLAIPEIEGGENAPSYTPVNVVRVDTPSAAEAALLEAEETSAPSPVVVNLDLTVDAGNGIFVRGRGLTAEWGTDLAITGTADAPVIIGDVDLVRGELLLAGREFDLTRGNASFSQSSGLNPFVAVEAQTETGTGTDSITAIATVEGPADALEFSFTSNPERPEEDVLALILFGRPANELGAAEAIQLAQVVATLTGTGPFGGSGGVGGAVRSGLGLDRLSYDPSGNELTVGKYVSEDIYVNARQSFSDVGTVISVIYEVSRFFSVETTLQPDGAQKLGANYKRDY
ncbi:MAG: translocation/assembly module TamB domain-containing protein [Pseudomonadota bacterium]